MKLVRNIALASVLTLSAFSAVTFTSCSKSDSGCAVGYEGSDCKTRTRDKFIGNWTGSDQCTSGTYNVNLAVGASSTDVQAIVTNPGGFGTNIVISGTVQSTTTLAFTNQSVGGGRTLSGTMTFNNNAMQFQYTVTPATGTPDNCTGNYTKQ